LGDDSANLVGRWDSIFCRLLKDGVDEEKLKVAGLDKQALDNLEELREASRIAKSMEESLLHKYDDNLNICLGKLAMNVEQLAKSAATITLEGAAAISIMRYGQHLANAPTGYSKVANFDGKAFGMINELL
jgi:hypothetical protein